jgi:hypothetical protein
VDERRTMLLVTSFFTEDADPHILDDRVHVYDAKSHFFRGGARERRPSLIRGISAVTSVQQLVGLPQDLFSNVTDYALCSWKCPPFLYYVIRVSSA